MDVVIGGIPGIDLVLISLPGRVEVRSSHVGFSAVDVAERDWIVEQDFIRRGSELVSFPTVSIC